MASGGYDANQDYSSDCVDECLIEKLCASCIKKLIPRQTKVINELTKNVLCSNCRAVVVQDGFKNHDIILVKKTDYDSTGVDMKGLDKCMQHKKNVKFYCEDHDRLCCSGCVIAHRKCDNFNEINAFSVPNGKEKELQSALIKVKEDSISIKHKIKELKAEMSETIINLSLDIDEIKNKVLKRIDDDKRLFLQETESITAEKTVSLEKRTDEMLKIEKDMSEALELFSISIQKGTPQQQWIVARAVSEMLRNAQTVIEGQRRNPLSMQMHLCFSRELTQLLHTEQNRVRLHIEEECKRADCSG
ncbi:E3 ubiquitin-protein ligase TRIM33-like isoform X1 [Dreissena polymorpha]|nr:E3 ubiquitin-protein ligase TRIM33-like isoform X1 [Dreissena polymorpha]